MKPNTAEHLHHTRSRWASASKLLAALALGALCVPMIQAAPAAHAETTVTVDTVAELQTTISGATADTTVTLGESFPTANPATVSITSGSGFNIVVDGSGKTLTAPPSGYILSATVNNGGSFTLQNLAFNRGSGGGGGGLALTQNGTAQVALNAVDFSGLGNTALNLAGGGTGALNIDDATFVNNTAANAAAINFARTAAAQESFITHSTFDSNRGTAGAGWSGGAMLVTAGSNGTLTIEETAFLNNIFDDAGTLPRGGAIAMHNSNVQLHLNNDYFYRNSTFTRNTGYTGSADGGAVSSFNSTPSTRGSIFVSGSTFEENEAQDDGSALFIEGRSSTTATSYPAKLYVENSTFINNVSGDGGGNDSGGAIQASGRAELSVQFSTFVGNTKANNRGGVDIGYHSILVTSPSIYFETPISNVANNIFTKRSSVDTPTIKCSVNVGCQNNASTIPSAGAAATEAKLLQEVFGTTTPAAQANGTQWVAGSARDGRATYPVSTVRIAPPLSADTTYTASEFASGPGSLTADQRGVPFKVAPDAGALEMGYVRFDAQTNGGSWSGITSTFPASGSSYVKDDSASTGWFEVGNPDQVMDLAADPTPPTGKVFAGWFTAATGGTQVTEPAAQSQTVYAQFVDQTYTVTFDSNGGSTVPEVSGIASGDTVAEPDEPTRAGFVFEGWELDGELYDFSTPITEDVTLRARWSLAPEADIGVTNVRYTYGETATFEVEVANAAEGAEVSLTVGGIDLGTATVVDGVATFTPDASLGLDSGEYVISATYTDGSQNPALVLTAEGTLTVVPDATTTSLTATLVSRSEASAEIRLSGSVASVVGTIPVGTVTFTINGVLHSVQVPVDANGNFDTTVTVAVPAEANTVTILAGFGGGLNHLASEASTTLQLGRYEAPVDPNGPGDEGGNGGGDGGEDGTPVVPAVPKGEAELSETGADTGVLAWGTVVALLAAGGSLLLVRRKGTRA